jgi:hypothetical protein
MCLFYMTMDWTIGEEQCQRIGGGIRRKLRFLLFL